MILRNLVSQVTELMGGAAPKMEMRMGIVTMVPAALSAEETREAGWVCVECEELGEEQ